MVKKDQIQTIYLDPFNIQKSLIMAMGRDIPKERTGVSSNRCDKGKTEFGLHWIGAIGEVALSEFLKIDTDREFYLHGDNGNDLIFRGRGIAVRSRSYYSNDLELYFNNEEEFNVPIAVLTRVYPDRVELMGCIGRTSFLEKCKEKDYGYGPRLVVPWYDLEPVTRLFELSE